MFHGTAKHTGDVIDIADTALHHGPFAQWSNGIAFYLVIIVALF